MHTSFHDIYLEADLPVLSQKSQQSCISVLGGINLISFYDCFIGYSTRSVTYEVISDQLSSTRCLKGYVKYGMCYMYRRKLYITHVFQFHVHMCHVQQMTIYFTPVLYTSVSCAVDNHFYRTCVTHLHVLCTTSDDFIYNM
jgi:hypothetical protein